MTIMDFLLARIAEDEAAAHAGTGKPQYGYEDTAADEVIDMAYKEGCAESGMLHFKRWRPDRVLAECQAKRRLVELHTPGPGYRNFAMWEKGFPGAEYVYDVCPACYHRDEDDNAGCVEAPCLTSKLLALPYANHPDYDEGWRP